MCLVVAVPWVHLQPLAYPPLFVLRRPSLGIKTAPELLLLLLVLVLGKGVLEEDMVV